MNCFDQIKWWLSTGLWAFDGAPPKRLFQIPSYSRVGQVFTNQKSPTLPIMSLLVIVLMSQHSAVQGQTEVPTGGQPPVPVGASSVQTLRPAQARQLKLNDWANAVVLYFTASQPLPNDFSFGELILLLEIQTSKVNEYYKGDDLKKALFKYNRLRVEAQRFRREIPENAADYRGPGWFGAQWPQIHKTVFGQSSARSAGFAYCSKTRNLVDALSRGCGNCVTNTHLLQALVMDLGVYIPHHDFGFFIEHADKKTGTTGHIESVVFRRSDQSAISLLSGRTYLPDQRRVYPVQDYFLGIIKENQARLNLSDTARRNLADWEPRLLGFKPSLWQQALSAGSQIFEKIWVAQEDDSWLAAQASNDVPSTSWLTAVAHGSSAETTGEAPAYDPEHSVGLNQNDFKTTPSFTQMPETEVISRIAEFRIGPSQADSLREASSAGGVSGTANLTSAGAVPPESSDSSGSDEHRPEDSPDYVSLAELQAQGFLVPETFLSAAKEHKMDPSELLKKYYINRLVYLKYSGVADEAQGSETELEVRFGRHFFTMPESQASKFISELFKACARVYHVDYKQGGECPADIAMIRSTFTQIFEFYSDQLLTELKLWAQQPSKPAPNSLKLVREKLFKFLQEDAEFFMGLFNVVAVSAEPHWLLYKSSAHELDAQYTYAADSVPTTNGCRPQNSGESEGIRAYPCFSVDSSAQMGRQISVRKGNGGYSENLSLLVDGASLAIRTQELLLWLENFKSPGLQFHEKWLSGLVDKTDLKSHFVELSQGIDEIKTIMEVMADSLSAHKESSAWWEAYRTATPYLSTKDVISFKFTEFWAGFLLNSEYFLIADLTEIEVQAFKLAIPRLPQPYEGPEVTLPGWSGPCGSDAAESGLGVVCVEDTEASTEIPEPPEDYKELWNQKTKEFLLLDPRTPLRLDPVILSQLIDRGFELPELGYLKAHHGLLGVLLKVRANPSGLSHPDLDDLSQFLRLLSPKITRAWDFKIAEILRPQANNPLRIELHLLPYWEKVHETLTSSYEAALSRRSSVYLNHIRKELKANFNGFDSQQLVSDPNANAHLSGIQTLIMGFGRRHSDDSYDGIVLDLNQPYLRSGLQANGACFTSANAPADQGATELCFLNFYSHFYKSWVLSSEMLGRQTFEVKKGNEHEEGSFDCSVPHYNPGSLEARSHRIQCEKKMHSIFLPVQQNGAGESNLFEDLKPSLSSWATQLGKIKSQQASAGPLVYVLDGGSKPNEPVRLEYQGYQLQQILPF